MIKKIKEIWLKVKPILTKIIIAIGVISTTILTIITVAFLSKKPESINKLEEKINNLKQEEKKNEEIICNADYDEHNDNGTIKRRKK
jgi:hypothetical protein